MHAAELRTRFTLRLLSLALLPLFAACSSTPSGMQAKEGRHINRPQPVAASIPEPVIAVPTLAKPKANPRTETYSVVVNNLPVSDLLFALGRDAKINIDIHPGVSGNVTLNAINQTMPQILDRISKQVDIRWKLDDGTLNVEPDNVYLETYRVDYFNIARNMKTTINIANSVASVSSTEGGSTNSSTTEIASTSPNDFWKTLEKNLNSLLQDEDKITNKPSATALNTNTTANTNTNKNDKSGSSTDIAALINALNQQKSATTPATPAAADQLSIKEANNVIINAETGTVVIRATQRKQKKIADFLAQIGASSQRQVMIEATVVEVTLSDQYQAGVDWSGSTSSQNWKAGQSTIGSNLDPTGALSFLSFGSNHFNATMSFLEQFGRTKVLSSPKLMALNNQTAVMKVVDEEVYFGLTIEEEKNDAGNVTSRTYTSTLHTVPVGLVMQVTPQIAESGVITLNVRPTITNIRGYVEDPAVAIMSAQGSLGVKSLIPNLQVREFDSTLKIPSGQVAVLGGLIQDSVKNVRNGVPGFSSLPYVGDLFSYREDKTEKIELVIFLRPITVKEGSVERELANYKQFTPGKDFFDTPSDHRISAFGSGVVPFKQSEPTDQSGTNKVQP